MAERVRDLRIHHPKSAVLRYVSVSVGSARRFPNRPTVLPSCWSCRSSSCKSPRNADATKPLDVGSSNELHPRHRSSSVGVICRGPDQLRRRCADLGRALEQHAAYVAALRDCGLAVTQLAPDPAYPDGTFVEDTAIVTGRGAVLTLPGAPSRQGEIRGMAPCLRQFYGQFGRIEAPARSTAATSAKPTDISSSEFRPVPTSTAPNSWQGFWRGSDTPRASWTSGPTRRCCI